MKVLWLARALPFPLDTGDRIYSARLIRALADAGADLTVVGLAAQPASAVPDDWPVRWHTIAGTTRPTWHALASTMPLVAAAHATPVYRAQVELFAQQDWDAVVFDQYGLGWEIGRARVGKECW